MARYRSHDEMAGAIRDARLSTYVLARAGREWELQAVLLGDGLLQHAVDGAPHVTTGRMRADRVGFLVPGTAPGHRSCGGQELDAGSIYRWGAGTDVVVQARQPGDWWLFSAKPEAVARAAASLGKDGEGPTPVSTGPVNAGAEGVAELRERFGEAQAAFDREHLEGPPAETARRLGEALLHAVVRLSCRASGSDRPSRRTRIDRGRIVSRVEEIFAEAESRPLYLQPLSEALGVPERTLRLVFTEQYGAGPTHVLRCRRLCQAQRALLHAPAGTRVAGIAARFGFWHLGQFASDYRALLGERPSETLRRRERGESGYAGTGGRWEAETAQSSGAAAF
jgi:AraC family transcriptional regulator, ethanolamine operon transcriptional activator